MAIKSEEELGEALKNRQDSIEIEGDLKRKVVKIRATGKVAWLVAIGALGVAVLLALGSRGQAAPVSGLVGIGAVSILGVSSTISALAIAIAAGGVGALNLLREYKVAYQDETRLVLRRT